MANLLMSLLVVAAIAGRTTAFLAPTKVHSSSSTKKTESSNHVVGKTTNAPEVAFASSRISSLSLSSSTNNNGNGSKDAFPKARTDIRNFLTQRSIQSFVHLLNLCREEHTVRWLEKTLDFNSIDNFHGTGAFNQTIFPEWDSIFLDCVDRPEEVIVMQMRPRRRQSKLSGHNAYFESLSNKSSAATSVAAGKTEGGSSTAESETTNGSFSTARNYLDSMKPTTLPSSTAKKSQVTKTTSRKLSGSSNYLDNLSMSPAVSSSSSPTTPKNKKNNSKKSNEKRPSLKDHGMKKSPTMVFDTKKSLQKSKKQITPRKSFGPGRSTNYLENLSTMSNATPSSDGKVDATKNEAKTKQSTETSKNPFLEENTREYELSIDPPALVRRILSVREQLSKEWVEDLEILINLNDEITEFFEAHNNKDAPKDDEEEEDDDDEEEIKSIEKKTKDIDDDKISSDLDAFLNALIAAPGDKNLDPEITSVSSNVSPDEDITEKVDPDKGKQKRGYDRSILSTWSQLLWSPKRSSSPYRKGNFDLLLLLATQESIHRVLNSYKKDETIRSETREWFLDFYKDNVNEYFDGHQTYARSEDFLEEMLKTPRTLIETNSEILAWIDPAIVAEDIVRERSEVALDWMRVAETILDEHTDLRRLLFTNMVSKSFPEDSLSDTILNAVKKDTEEDPTSSPTEVFGAFE